MERTSPWAWCLHVQAEILDESDIYEDVNRRLIRRDRERADIASYLAMFDHKLHSTALSNAEMAAVASFLVLNVEEFAPLLAPHDLPLKVRSISTCKACAANCRTVIVSSAADRQWSPRSSIFRCSSPCFAGSHQFSRNCKA